MAGFAAWYNGLLATRPLATKMATSALLWGVGDALGQQVQPAPDGKYNWFTTTRMVRIGDFVVIRITSILIAHCSLCLQMLPRWCLAA